MCIHVYNIYIYIYVYTHVYTYVCSELTGARTTWRPQFEPNKPENWDTVKEGSAHTTAADKSLEFVVSVWP